MLYKINKNVFCEANILKNILPSFNIYNADITMVKFKDTDKQRAVYKVTTLNNSYCLKKIYFSEEELLYVYSALEWLYRNNINVPKLLPSSNGGRYTKYNDMLFILTPWIEGNKCSFDSHDNIIKASIELAKLHESSINFKAIEGSSIRTGFDNIYESLSKHSEQILRMSNLAFKYKDNFSEKYLDDFDINLELCKLSLNCASKINISNLSKSLCHGDYVNKNILFTQNNDLWIIDFDNCKNDYCAHDFSYFLRRLLKREKTNWNIDIAFSMLNAYNSTKTLSPSDLHYIIAYLCFPQKYWKISKDYYKNIFMCNKDSYLKLITKCSKNQLTHLNFCKNIIEIMENINWTL